MPLVTGRYNFIINQGSDLTMPLILKDSTGSVINLLGYTAHMQIRKCYKSKTVVDNLSSENERILIEPSLGKITLYFPHLVTETYPSTPDLPLVYDIEIKSGGEEVTRILQGTIFVSPESTRGNDNAIR